MKMPPNQRAATNQLAFEIRGATAMNNSVPKGTRRVWNKWFLVFSVTVVTFGCVLTAAQVENLSQAKTAVEIQQTSPGAAEQSPAHKYFTDVLLINQNGEKMRFYSDLLQGKVVIINSFFGTCQGSCLPMNRNLEKVQEALGDRVGKDVRIISISVDPTVDTPPVLKEYAKKLHARPGLVFSHWRQAERGFRAE